MQCPNDQTTLAMTERQGIEIDYCPTCRGVWLDRGELDKLMAAGSGVSHSSSQSAPHYPKQDSYVNNNGHGQYKKKRESFLSDLFDF